MKRINSVIAILASILFMGCTEDLLPPNGNVDKSNFQDDHVVSYSDLQILLNAKTPGSRAEEISSKITCMKGRDNDTLLYVFHNGNDGWTIYSSDTRVPAVVASSETGNFSEAMKNEAMALWIQSIMDDMKAIRMADDSELKFTADEIQNNKRFWRSISHAEEFIKSSASRGFERPTDPFPQGHYELIGSVSHEEEYDQIPRLTTTNWSQETPYNNACPLKSGNSSDRAVAGCGPIAVSQMLHFLHSFYGVPEKAPSEAYCDSRVNETYHGAQTNFTETIWDQMSSVPSYAAPLIAHVGRVMNAQYTDSVTGVTVDSIQPAFQTYGISCSQGDYDDSVVKNSLLGGMPVLIAARAYLYQNINDQNLDGHAFIIDRYKRSRTVTENTYEWVPDDLGTGSMSSDMPRTTSIVYSTPHIYQISMNWGWGEPLFFTQWFSLTGDWIRYNRNWNVQRKMFYNFIPKNK